MLDELVKPSKPRRRKVELHAQTNAFTPQAAASPEEVLAMADASGYSAVFLTERDRVWPERQLAGLRELSVDVQVYPGIEVMLDDGHAVLVLGATAQIYETLKEPAELLAQAAKDGHLTVLCAPQDEHAAVPEWISLIDAIEVRTCYQASSEWQQRAQSRATVSGIAPVQAGGVQGLNYLNKFWLELDAPYETLQDFRNLIVSRSYRNEARDFDMQVPPPFKTPRMADLTEEDSSALPNGPEPSLSAE